MTLTKRDCGLSERAPMCGVPHHAADLYISRLVNKGYKVAICDQVEDASQAKGLVKREIVRIVTPGTVTDSAALDETKYPISPLSTRQDMYLVWQPAMLVPVISETTALLSEAADRRLVDELSRLRPCELLINQLGSKDLTILSWLREMI